MTTTQDFHPPKFAPKVGQSKHQFFVHENSFIKYLLGIGTWVRHPSFLYPRKLPQK
jgi:hypothetical protein